MPKLFWKDVGMLRHESRHHLAKKPVPAAAAKAQERKMHLCRGVALSDEAPENLNTIVPEKDNATQRETEVLQGKKCSTLQPSTGMTGSTEILIG